MGDVKHSVSILSLGPGGYEDISEVIRFSQGYHDITELGFPGPRWCVGQWHDLPGMFLATWLETFYRCEYVVHGHFTRPHLIGILSTGYCSGGTSITQLAWLQHVPHCWVSCVVASMDRSIPQSRAHLCVASLHRHPDISWTHEATDSS